MHIHYDFNRSLYQHLRSFTHTFPFDETEQQAVDESFTPLLDLSFECSHGRITSCERTISIIQTAHIEFVSTLREHHFHLAAIQTKIQEALRELSSIESTLSNPLLKRKLAALHQAEQKKNSSQQSEHGTNDLLDQQAKRIVRKDSLEKYVSSCRGKIEVANNVLQRGERFFHELTQQLNTLAHTEKNMFTGIQEANEKIAVLQKEETTSEPSEKREISLQERESRALSCLSLIEGSHNKEEAIAERRDEFVRSLDHAF